MKAKANTWLVGTGRKNRGKERMIQKEMDPVGRKSIRVRPSYEMAAAKI